MAESKKKYISKRERKTTLSNKFFSDVKPLQNETYIDEDILSRVIFLIVLAIIFLMVFVAVTAATSK